LLLYCATLTDLAEIYPTGEAKSPFYVAINALIPPKNVLYIEKMDRNDVATGALPIREPYFSVVEFPGLQFRGRAIHA
jgi:hypothetical protein